MEIFTISKNTHTTFIAAADCTGHGVPGAIMSMICSEKLEESISTSENTSEILGLVNKRLKLSLKQSENDNSTRDGMDIALCTINKENRIVNYSGANRPLWIIRKGSDEVEEIKPIKCAIGGTTPDNQVFSSHEIKLNQGDTFYLFTDGYADQFNGKTGKKIMTKKLNSILADLQANAMHEQEMQLDPFLENWKKGTEQVDDILIMGIRL